MMEAVTSPWLQEQIEEWERALARLQAEGWTAELTTSAAPVQIQGFLPTGEQFYFRSRHHEASMAIGGDDPADGAPWNAFEICEDASYLPADRGLDIILRMWGQYRDAK